MLIYFASSFLGLEALPEKLSQMERNAQIDSSRSNTNKGSKSSNVDVSRNAKFKPQSTSSDDVGTDLEPIIRYDINTQYDSEDEEMKLSIERDVRYQCDVS